MVSPLEGVRLKIDRARSHYEDLDACIGEYFGRNPHSRTMEHDPQSDLSAWRFRVTEDPPPELPLVIGDCIQNLRASLDFIAWELVLAEGLIPNESTYFPIWTSRLNKKGEPKPPINIRPGLKRSPVLAVLDTVQPYRRSHQPEAHPLAVLNKVARLDKHRYLQLTKGQADQVTVHIVDPNDGRILNIIKHPGIVRDGDLIAIHDSSAYMSNLDANAEVRGHFFLAFQEPGPWGDKPVLEILRTCIEYVEKIVYTGFAVFLEPIGG